MAAKVFTTIQIQGQPYKCTYTIDRLAPYTFDSGHKRLSRVLQGFEVVLLTVLVFQLLKIKAKVISLDQDGVLVTLSNRQFEEFNSDPIKLTNVLFDSLFFDFLNYLLFQNIPIEPKRIIIQGKQTEY